MSKTIISHVQNWNSLCMKYNLIKKENVWYDWYILWSKSKKTLSLKSILYAVFDMFLAPYILYEYMQDYIIYSNIWVCKRPNE